jgi:cell division protein FtsZ
MAMMGLGIGTGTDKASVAINMAISSPMLENNDISGAKGVLVNITGSSSMNMDDYNTINRIISERVHNDATIKIGVVQDDTAEDIIKVTVIATGFGGSFNSVDENKQNKVIRLVPDIHTLSSKELDIPPHLRNKPKDEKADQFRKSQFATDFDEEYYDIPAYLRKPDDEI